MKSFSQVSVPRGPVLNFPSITRGDLVSLLFYAGLGFVAFFPCLALGNAYFDGDLLNSNTLFRQYLRDNLLQGRLPLWNPHLFGGEPFLANVETMVCYPPLYATLVFPVAYGFGVFYFLHFLIAAAGMHLWLRTFKLSEEACRVGAVLFALSGHFWWEIVHPTLLAAFAWMPWWGMTLERTSERLKPVWLFLAGLVFAVLFSAGSFQMTMGALYGGGAYLAFRLLTRPGWRQGPLVWKRSLSAPLFFLWGALPLLVIWIPAREFLGLSARMQSVMDLRETYEVFQADLSIHPAMLGSFLFPVTPFSRATGEALPMTDYLANCGYLGPWVFLLVAAAFRSRPRRSVLFLALASSCALFISLGKYFPLHRWLCDWAPGLALTRAPFRFAFLYVIGLSLLAGIGYEILKGEMAKKRGKRLSWIAAGTAAYVLAMACFAFWRGWEAWPQWAGLGLGGAALILWMGKKDRGKPAQTLFLVSLVLCLLPTGWRVCATRWGPSSNLDFTARCEALGRVKEKAGLGRVFLGDKIPYPVRYKDRPLQLELPTDAAMVAGIRNAGGYDPLFLQKPTELYSLPARTLNQLMAVKGFLTGNPRWLSSGYPREDWGTVQYYKNPREVRFAYAPSRVETILDDGKRLQEMGRTDFKPYETAYFSQDIPVSMRLKGPPARLEYGIVRDEPDDQRFRVEIDRPGWVVFSEVVYPGWKVRVDGEDSPLFTANHAFRAVWVPSGRHDVRFYFRPDWLEPILFGLIAWVLSVTALIWRPFRMKIFHV